MQSVALLTYSGAENRATLPPMIPGFTIISTIITVAVTGLLVFVLYRINLPAMRDGRRGGADGAIPADGGGRRNENDGDGGSDGGGD